ncbi:MAG: LysR family transcriptional regulator [Methylobacteriaceae bacterium]|jgi:DNA-binding transcriptional LysR family regulator|nr:LysR family transcriptional regulator [Methylobacteriaceae bacterium]
MRIHPRQVEAFRAVMLTGGITQAARFMNITQPAVSRLIRDFEAELKLRLFERDGGRLAPREEAIALHREVERLYVGLDHIGVVANDLRYSKDGAIKIGSVAALSRICMDHVIGRFSARHPHVSITFETESTERILALTALHQYDIGLIFAHFEQWGLSTEKLADGHAVAVLAGGHPLAGRASISLEDISAHRAVVPGRRTPLRMTLDEKLAEAGLSLVSPIEASLANCATLAAQGVGVGITDSLTAQAFTGRAVLLPLVPGIPVTYSVVLPPQAPRNSLVELFRGSLIETLGGEAFHNTLRRV